MSDPQLSILVIDDDEDVRQLLIEILLPDEHQVFAVGSAEEGLQLLPYHTFHVAFLDQNLPGMEGLVLGEFLTKNNPQMKVALVTGNQDPRLPKTGEKLGMSFIAKPFGVKQILDVVDAYRQSQEASVDLLPVPAEKHPFIGGTSLAEAYGELNVPERLEEKLVRALRGMLAELRVERRYEEGLRVKTYAGLVALAALGVDPPKLPSGLTMFEEYDAIMARYGLARAFTSGARGS